MKCGTCPASTSAGSVLFEVTPDGLSIPVWKCGRCLTACEQQTVAVEAFNAEWKIREERRDGSTNNSL